MSATTAVAVPASSTPDSSNVSRTAAQTSEAASAGEQPIRAAHSAGEGPVHSDDGRSASRGSTPPPGKTDMPAAKAIATCLRRR